MAFASFLLFHLFFCASVLAEGGSVELAPANTYGLEPDVYQWYIDKYWGLCGETEDRVYPTVDYSELLDSWDFRTTQSTKGDAVLPATHPSSAPAAEITTPRPLPTAAKTPAAPPQSSGFSAGSGFPQLTPDSESTGNIRFGGYQNNYAEVPPRGKTRSLFITFPSEAQEARNIANQDRLNREFLAQKERQTIPEASNFELAQHRAMDSKDLLDVRQDPYTRRRKRAVSTQHEVVGGHEATKTYPWMVPLVAKGINNNYIIWCGSSLITDRHLLSAAHCFNRKSDPTFFSALIRVHNLNEPEEEVDLERILIHPRYEKKLFYNDIAIVTLVREVFNFKPLCLPVGDEAARVGNAGSTVEVLGFGSLAFGDGASKTLQVAELEIFASEVCHANYSTKPDSSLNKGIVRSQICAGTADGYADACQNDSGGPLVNDDRNERRMLIGIVSFGYQCARPGFPGVYTRITEYLPWIMSTIRDFKSN